MDSDPNPANVEWSIPKSEVLDGGPGKDGIPALVNPGFVETQNTNFLQDISTGQQLNPVSVFTAFWFSIPAFYEMEIYDN